VIHGGQPTRNSNLKGKKTEKISQHKGGGGRKKEKEVPYQSRNEGGNTFQGTTGVRAFISEPLFTLPQRGDWKTEQKKEKAKDIPIETLKEGASGTGRRQDP